MYLGYFFFRKDRYYIIYIRIKMKCCIFFSINKWHACCHDRLLEKTWSPGMCSFSDANEW